MKVIKNNKDAQEEQVKLEDLEFPMIHVCTECGSEIEIEEEDLEDLNLSSREVHTGYYCPICGEWNTVVLTEPHNWPESFYHYGHENNVVKVSDGWIQKFVDTVVKFLEDSKIGDTFETGAGDIVVIGRHQEDCKQIIVAEKYWEETYDYTD